MNRIRSKDHRIGTYEINKISLSCFDDKIYIQKNGYDRLPLGNQSSSYLNYLEKFPCQAYYFNFQSNQDNSFLAKHIVRLLAWHINFDKNKALKKKDK